MTIRYRHVEQDILDGFQLHWRRKMRLWRFLLIVFIVACCAITVFYLTGSPLTLPTVIAWFAVSLAYMALLFAASRLVGRYRSLKIFRNSPAAHEDMEISWDAERLHGRQTSGEMRQPWTNFESWTETAHLFVIFTAGPTFHLLPKRAMTEAQEEDLRQCLSHSPLPQARLFPI